MDPDGGIKNQLFLVATEDQKRINNPSYVQPTNGGPIVHKYKKPINYLLPSFYVQPIIQTDTYLFHWSTADGD